MQDLGSRLNGSFGLGVRDHHMLACIVSPQNDRIELCSLKHVARVSCKMGTVDFATRLLANSDFFWRTAQRSGSRVPSRPLDLGRASGIARSTLEVATITGGPRRRVPRCLQMMLAYVLVFKGPLVEHEAHVRTRRSRHAQDLLAFTADHTFRAQEPPRHVWETCA